MPSINWFSLIVIMNPHCPTWQELSGRVFCTCVRIARSQWSRSILFLNELKLLKPHDLDLRMLWYVVLIRYESFLPRGEVQPREGSIYGSENLANPLNIWLEFVISTLESKLVNEWPNRMWIMWNAPILNMESILNYCELWTSVFICECLLNKTPLQKVSWMIWYLVLVSRDTSTMIFEKHTFDGGGGGGKTITSKPIKMQNRQHETASWTQTCSAWTHSPNQTNPTPCQPPIQREPPPTEPAHQV